MQRSLAIFIVALAISTAGRVAAQQREQPSILFHPATVPSALQKQVLALGERVSRDGKELTAMVGQFTDANGSRAATITHQLPNLVLVEGVKTGGAVLAFDGSRPVTLSAADEKLLETFVADMPEGFLSAVRRGAAMRLLGLNFGPDPRRVRNYTGPRYDIYEATSPVPSRVDRTPRTKRYQFDSKTGFLATTRYSDGNASSLNVEIRFSSWTKVGTSAYPGRIERFEDGKPVFSFVITQSTSGPKQDVSTFRNR